MWRTSTRVGCHDEARPFIVGLTGAAVLLLGDCGGQGSESAGSPSSQPLPALILLTVMVIATTSCQEAAVLARPALGAEARGALPDGRQS